MPPSTTTDKPFGYSYMLDMFACAPGVADSMELHYRFLEQLVEKIGMTPMSTPHVIHGPRVKGKEVYPDKEGISAWIPLIESGIQIHSLEPSHEMYIDVFSCNNFDPSIVFNFAHEMFGFQLFHDEFVVRGMARKPYIGPITR
jgi:S-adenosylmethionine/arginine decarboxylase-like enzyme